jgi:hypothetical protein
MTLYYIKYYDSIKVISIQKTSVTDRCGVSSSVVVSLYQFSEDLSSFRNLDRWTHTQGMMMLNESHRSLPKDGLMQYSLTSRHLDLTDHNKRFGVLNCYF